MRKKTYPVKSSGAAAEAGAKIARELSSMGYSVHMSEPGSGRVCVYVKKDLGIIDMFLGRWQKFQVGISETETEEGQFVSVNISGKFSADKFVCAAVGAFVFAIPWIFGLIARSNRRNAEKVAERTAENCVSKFNSEYSEEA